LYVYPTLNMYEKFQRKFNVWMNEKKFFLRKKNILTMMNLTLLATILHGVIMVMVWMQPLDHWLDSPWP
jgi:hypothetical protein